MMQVPGAGQYLRALLPVRLTDGTTVVHGVWIAVAEEDLHRAFGAWWSPEYADLRIVGRLASDLTPWRVLDSPVELAVLQADQTPYCVSSTDPVLAGVLSEPQPPAPVRAAIGL